MPTTLIGIKDKLQTDYYIKYSNGLIIQGGRIAWTSGNTYSGALPTSVTISKVCNVTLTETELNSGSTSSGHITSISGGTVSVQPFLLPDSL